MPPQAPVIDWHDRIKKHFEDFRPETRSVTIDLARCTSGMSFKVAVPGGWRKRHNKIALPAYGGSGVVGMMDDSFNDHKRLWRRVGSEFVLDADDLPSAETYLVTMEGRVDMGQSTSGRFGSAQNSCPWACPQLIEHAPPLDATAAIKGTRSAPNKGSLDHSPARRRGFTWVQLRRRSDHEL